LFSLFQNELLNFLRRRQKHRERGGAADAPVGDAPGEADGIQMIEQGHGIFAGNAQGGANIDGQQAGRRSSNGASWRMACSMASWWKRISLSLARSTARTMSPSRSRRSVARLAERLVMMVLGSGGERPEARSWAAVRNWDSYGQEVALAPGLKDWQRDVMADPQTSGGLLIAVAPQGVDAVLTQLHAAGFGQAAVTGEMAAGVPRLHVS
jgi:hypothetical protein